METTEPINGNDLGAVAENLIMDAPQNSDEATDEVVDQVVDEQPEAMEAGAEGQDDVDVSSDDELEFHDDAADIEIDEPEVEQEPLYTVKVDGQEKQSLDELTRGYSGQEYIKRAWQKTPKPKGG